MEVRSLEPFSVRLNHTGATVVYMDHYMVSSSRNLITGETVATVSHTHGSEVEIDGGALAAFAVIQQRMKIADLRFISRHTDGRLQAEWGSDLNEDDPIGQAIDIDGKGLKFSVIWRIVDCFFDDGDDFTAATAAMVKKFDPALQAHHVELLAKSLHDDIKEMFEAI